MSQYIFNDALIKCKSWPYVLERSILKVRKMGIKNATKEKNTYTVTLDIPFLLVCTCTCVRECNISGTCGNGKHKILFVLVSHC